MLCGAKEKIPISTLWNATQIAEGLQGHYEMLHNMALELDDYTCGSGQ